MAELTDPFLEVKWGYVDGEDAWGNGQNENLIKLAFFSNRRIDGSVALLPPTPTDGDAYFLTTDQRVWYRANSTWYSSVIPIGTDFRIKSSGDVVFYDGTATLSPFVPHDTTQLSFAGDPRAIATSDGLAIRGATSNDPTTPLLAQDVVIRLQNAGGAAVGNLGFTQVSSTLRLENLQRSGLVRASGLDAAGATVDFFTGNPVDGNFTVNFGANVAHRSTSEGVSLFGASVGEPTASAASNTRVAFFNQGATNQHGFVGFEGGNMLLHSDFYGGNVVIRLTDGVGAPLEAMLAEPDVVALYHPSSANFAMYTNADGIAVLDPDGTNSTILFNDQNDTTQAQILSAVTGFNVQSLVNGVPMLFSGNDAGGILRSGIGFDPDGAASQYHIGVAVTNTLTAAAGGLQVNNTLTGAGLERVLTVSDLAGAGAANVTDIALGAAVTDPTGILPTLELRDNIATVLASIRSQGGTLILDNPIDGFGMQFFANDVGSASQQLLSLSPDGAGVLYHAGNQAARTATPATGGLEANNQLTGSGFERVLTTSDALAVRQTIILNPTVQLLTGGKFVERTQAGVIYERISDNVSELGLHTHVNLQKIVVSSAQDEAEYDGKWWHFDHVYANYVPHSENFNDAGWTATRTSLTSAAGMGPDAIAASAFDLVEDGTVSATHILTATDSGNIYVDSETFWGLSIFVKRNAGTRNLRLRLPSTAFPVNCDATFDLSNGTVNAVGAGADSAYVEELTDGWYRCVVMAQSTAGVAGTYEIVMLDGSFTEVYSGDSTSSLLIYGAMFADAYDQPSTGTYIRSNSTGNMLLYGPIEYDPADVATVIPLSDEPYSLFTRYNIATRSLGASHAFFAFLYFGTFTQRAIITEGISPFLGNQGDIVFLDGANSLVVAGPLPEEGTVAMVGDGTTNTCYINGVNVGTFAQEATEHSYDIVNIGSHTSLSLLDSRIYPTELTAEEIEYLSN